MSSSSISLTQLCPVKCLILFDIVSWSSLQQQQQQQQQIDNYLIATIIELLLNQLQ